MDPALRVEALQVMLGAHGSLCIKIFGLFFFFFKLSYALKIEFHFGKKPDVAF